MGTGPRQPVPQMYRNAAAAGIGPVILGRTFDLTGSYAALLVALAAALALAAGLRRPRPRAAYSGWFAMCSAEHATRTRRHPELVPPRCCLRLRKTTPVPLVQVLSLLAQCAPGVWSYQSQRARPCTTSSRLSCP